MHLTILSPLAALLTVFVLMASARADDATELVFHSRHVQSALNADFRIALGDRYSPSFIKGRFQPYTVTFSDECEMECYVISRNGVSFNIYGSEESGKITALSSWSERAADSLGIRVGTPLREALKTDRARCEYAESLMCRSAVPGLSYFVDSEETCEWGVRWDSGEISVRVPACARVGGFHISAY